MEYFQQGIGCCNSNVVCDGTINHFEVEDLVLGLEECENSHTLTTTTTGSKNSQKEVNNQIENQNQCSVPPKDSFFTGSWSCLKSSAHTQQQNS